MSPATRRRAWETTVSNSAAVSFSSLSVAFALPEAASPWRLSARACGLLSLLDIDLAWCLLLLDMASVPSRISDIQAEVSSQPSCWRQASALASVAALPDPGARVALVGCGTSRFVAEAVAAWREAGGHGESDAFAASEMPDRRSYDVVVVISRSGTTTEVLRLVNAVSSHVDVLAITGDPSTPIAEVSKRNISLRFADERAVVQTRFATSVLVLWRAHFGHDVDRLARQAEEALSGPLPERVEGYRQYVFLGQGAGVGLANEAALKLREASLCWSEAYPAMELRHGPISLLDEGSLVWSLDPLPPGLEDDIKATGATLEGPAGQNDPMVELVRVHRAGIAIAEAKGLDPGRPRHLARSVVLQ